MIGDNIKKARQQMRLSQSKLARLVGVSPQSVQQWETGITQPKRNRISKLATFLNTSSEELEFGQSSQSTTTNNHSGIHNIQPLSQFESEFLNAFRILSPQQQKSLLLIVESIKEDQEDTLEYESAVNAINN